MSWEEQKSRTIRGQIIVPVASAEKSFPMKKKIILVEDELDLLNSVTLTLRRAGYEVVAVGNGTDALNFIMIAQKIKEPFDLLVTDLHLPGLSGIELIDKVRKSGNAMAVAAITAFGNSKARMVLDENDCKFCLDKPFNVEELLHHVSKALGAPAEAKIPLDDPLNKNL
jgi:two-component system response regulator AtoC